MAHQDGLTFAAAHLDPLAALRQPTTALLGVSPAGRAALAALGIDTVFDLAASWLFAAAAEIATAARESTGRLAAVGIVPGEILTANTPDSLAAVAGAGVEVLRSIGAANEQSVKQELNLNTVGDLGRWPPYLAARTVLAAAVGGAGNDAEETASLVPKLGEFPTERRFYSTVVIDHVANAAAVDLANAGPIDIAPTVAADFGFSAPAVGARLTFAQSWYAHGLTLGNLLHSVALAPGESTRIAIVDWARQSRGSAVEGITESERLSAETRHNRAISEVQDAVATEVQTGFSRTESSSTTKAGGGGFGFSAGPISVGGSASIGKSSTEAESFSTSFGARNLSASMNQRVADATQQAASSVRDRRASIVQEVSEAEHEGVSSRILANYNHMHALTVQYFEVVEVYRVVVDLHRVERCLFVPMKIIDFNDAIIQRYQGALAAAAMDRRARELLTTEFGVVRISSTVRMSPFPTVFGRLEELRPLVATRIGGGGEGAGEGGMSPTRTPEITIPARGIGGLFGRRVPVPAEAAWDADEVSRIGRLVSTTVLRPGQADLFLPDEAELVGMTLAIDAEGTSTPPPPSVSLVLRNGNRIDRSPTSAGEVTLTSPVPLVDIGAIEAARGGARARGRMVLQVSYRGTRFPVTVPIDVASGNGRQEVMRVGASEAGEELSRHLADNRLHYSQAVWRSLDPSAIALLLSRFTWEGRPVSDQVDPSPILVSGNYLVFRMPGFSKTNGVPDRAAANEEANLAAARSVWDTWLADHGVILGRDAAAEQLVPIPTGGVFAEAVLGRSNSAEKLDATRFWNWQDSPIPLQPPEIAAITMGSRHDPGTTPTPGQLGQPVLNIVNPTNLPDPTGLGPILGAVQNGSMFRDMSGLAATIGLAQATAGEATTAGTEAGRQAAANLAVAAQKEVEMARIAAQVALASMGVPAGSAGTPKNHSEMGALLNAGDHRDSRQSGSASGRPAAGSGGGGGAPGTEGSGETDGGAGDFDGGLDAGATDDTDVMPGVPAGMEDRGSGGTAYERALWGPLGMPAGNLVLAGVTKKSAATHRTVEIAVAASFPTPWPNATEETKALREENNAHWSPTIVDFRSAAKTIVKKQLFWEVNTLGELLGVLEGTTKAKLKIKRLSLFSHANAQNLAMAGTVQADGTVLLGAPDAANPLGSRGIDIATLDALDALLDADTSGLRKRIQQAWARDAELWVYACDAAVSSAFTSRLADALGVRVRAFDEQLWFLPSFTSNPDKVVDRNFFGVAATEAAARAAMTKKLLDLDDEGQASNP